LKTYFAECDCQCPVLFAKSDWSLPSADLKSDTRYEHIAIGVAENAHSDSGFKFLLDQLRISKPSELVVIHVVLNREDKPLARGYLESFKPLCKGKPYPVRSALVYARKDKSIAGGLTTFSRDRKLDLMCISPKPQGGKKARVGGKTLSHCLVNLFCDFLIFKDERTMADGTFELLKSRPSSKWLTVDEFPESSHAS